MTVLDTRRGTAGSVAAPRSAALNRLVAVNALSMTGNTLLAVAVPWLVLTTTGSAAVTGAAVFTGAASATVGGLVAGRVVDTIGAVRAASLADLLSGLAVAPLPVLLALDSLEVWQVLLLTVLGTLADAAGSSARQSLVPVVADAGGQRRERANALFTSAEHVGYLVGAPAAGLLISAFGIVATFCATGAAFLASALGMLRLADLTGGPGGGSSAGAVGIRETMAFIWGDPALRALVVFPTAAVLLVGPLVPLVLPVLARVVFDDPVVLGAMVACYGVGGLLGAAAYGVLGPRVTPRALYRGIFVVWPCAYAATLLVPDLAITLVMLLTIGAAAGSLVPLQATVRQERAPAHLLPRVVGLSTATIPVAVPVGALLTGILIDVLGLGQASLLLAGAALAVGAAVSTSRATRHLGQSGTQQIP
jgi:predicted MFS family arabinose efflux permease